MPNTKSQVIKSDKKFPVVGIGASAGGLDAFKKFLAAITPDSGMAYVVVQHLDPKHQSILPDILSRVTEIPVHEITDEIKLEPDNIYVIPANKTLCATDGILLLEAREKGGANHAVDKFFKSLAIIHENYAVGIVLSGNGSDGTLGLKTIKEHGGITFAQDDSSANNSMPTSAILSEVVDFILAPEKIPEQLLLINRTYKANYLDSDAALTVEEEGIVRQIHSMLKLRTGVDFTYYKQTTIRRRLARRMALAKTVTLADYLKYLQKNKEELPALFQDTLIPVTSFFRDPKTWSTLSETVLSSLIKNKPPGDPIRIWSAACSTGEEAYSFAILVHEFLKKESISRHVQIFGSDVSEPAIMKARGGIYNEAEVKNISDERLNNYFTKNNGSYQVNRTIRDMCVFAVHNFLKDPPFNKIDIVSCRNVLIYLDTFLQKKALTTFHYALKDPAFLVLGKSETAAAASDLFTPFVKPDKIFARKVAPGRFTPVAVERKDPTATQTGKKTFKSKFVETDFRKSAETILLSKYTPPSVIVNEHMDIVHINGIISDFLEPSPGKPTFNLIKMARGCLGFELRNAIQKVKATNTAFSRGDIPLDNHGSSFIVDVEVIPLADTVDQHFLVLFKKNIPASAPVFPDLKDLDENDHAYIRIVQLEKELAQAREDMLSITAEQEAANEELQSANEELLSGSEELQSLNEELETTKEEVQSTNEELIVVNQELMEKQEQLNRDRLYAEAIIETLREPFIILDKSFRIKTGSVSFYKKFNLTAKDTEGKLFYEISGGQWNDPFLRSMLEKILEKKSKLDDFEFAVNVPLIGRCTMLLNARQIVSDKYDDELLLLAIEDITEQKITSERQKHFAQELEVKVKERTLALEQTNLQLEQYSHTASHEFQEPLRKIVTFAKELQNLPKESVPVVVTTYLNKIEAASIRMSKLIQDMLNYAGVTNYMKLLEKTDLNKILKDVLFDFELLITDKKVEIKVGELPEIEAVPFQMNQLFYDLISNSLKFHRPDVQGIIEISSRKLTREQLKAHLNLDPKLKYCQITVKDNGIGFDQKYAQQIFSMFQRLHENGAYPGTGIGLALCKKIVQSYHGEIFTEGVENVGASFHIILPLIQPKPVMEIPFVAENETAKIIN